jgi:release factor glutamine methyltransferase
VRRTAKHLLLHAYRPFALRVIAADRTSRFRGLRLDVPRGVFHPGLFFSTGFMAADLERRDLAGKRVLDVGTGSGALALVAARAGAAVTAVDINPAAVRAARENVVRADLTVRVLESDLFSAVRGERFDVIVANPPYFRRDPEDTAERAWHAGAGLQWFERFFGESPDHLAEGGCVLMVLAETCDLAAIGESARRAGWRELGRRRGLVWLEEQYVLELGR